MQPESNAFSASCSALADACRRRRAARAAWADKLHALIERADNSHATERLTLPNCGGHRIEYAVTAAISADGRGHFLASYDGEEVEEGGGFLYRVN